MSSACSNLNVWRRLVNFPPTFAHEIRNPLMAMGGFAKVLIKDESIDPPGREKIQIILEEAQRLDRLLKSILSFVRSRMWRKNSIDVNRVAADAMQLLSLGCQLQKLKWKWTLIHTILWESGEWSRCVSV